jgi:hypothetical protein
MDKDNDALLQEWKELRSEITRKQSFVETLIVTTVSGDLLIFSFAATQQIIHPVNAFIALALPLILTTLSYFWILRYFYSGVRISKYIKDVIEPETGLNWETYVNSIRGKTDPGGKVRFRADTFSVFYHSLITLALLVSLVLIWSPFWPYATNTAQSSTIIQTSPGTLDTYLILSLVAIGFWVLWYVFARWLFINTTIKDTRYLMSQLQGLERTRKRNT